MGIMGIVWMILVGFIVGALARFVYPGAVRLGFWLTRCSASAARSSAA